MKYLLSLLLLFHCLTAFAQSELPVSPAIQAAYRNGTRDLTGKPGPAYWQNTGQYDLQVSFTPATREVKGAVNVTYFNNSPDTLHQLWFKLYPNLYQKGVERNAKVAEADLGVGVAITELRVNGQRQEKTALVVEGTNMHLAIAALAPGKRVKLHILYSYILNKVSHVRTGQVGEGAYFIAYFFPRIAVYDDVDGWDKLPYKGRDEFYNDFGDFKVAITVPKDYVVWATGDLRNARQVLTARIAERLRQAEQSDTQRNVIDSLDLQRHQLTRQRAFNTWRFKAKNVSDFAFALSNQYLWQSSSVEVDAATKRRTRVDAVFNPKHRDFYEVARFARQTVQAMSTTLPKWPFPYAHETVFDGRADMEYPMMINQSSADTREGALTTTDHEVFHTMFPFYLGTNESHYAWMDEGWAAMGEWLISTKLDSAIIDTYGIKEYGQFSGDASETPIMTPTPLLKGNNFGNNTYTKPALAYLYLKDYLGDVAFTAALHLYIRQWQGKHPMPFDFFFSMSEGAGKNLNWFWKRWFFENSVVDMAIRSVAPESGGYAVQIENKGGKPLPVDVTCTYADGSIQKLHRSVGVWEQGNTTTVLQVLTRKKLRKVVLGSDYVPDKDSANNIFEVN
jgi:hypothetical protein